MALDTKVTLSLSEFRKPLVLGSSPAPTSAPHGSAIIQVLAVQVRPHYRAGFNGQQMLPFPVPYTPGGIGIGRIVHAGPDAVALKPGHLVLVDAFISARDDPDTHILLGLSNMGGPRSEALFDTWPGLWSNIAAVPLENCIPLDEGLLCDKMGYAVADLTYIERLAVAYGGLCAARVRPGQTVVVAPATGNYSGSIVELAAQMGCRVVAITRSEAKLQSLAALYPGRVFPLVLKGDLDADVAAVAELSPSGVDAYLDMSPPGADASSTYMAVGMAALAPGGHAVLLGVQGDVTINYLGVMARGITIAGQFMYSRGQMVDLVKMVETGVLKLGRDAGHETTGSFKLEQWDEATLAAEKATQWGQQVLFMP